MTDCILGYGRLSISDDLTPEPIEVIRLGRQGARAPGRRPPPGRVGFLAWSSYMMGDFVSCAGCLDHYEGSSPRQRTAPPVVVEDISILHDLSQMILDGATPEIRSALSKGFERLRRATVPTWFVGPVANDLLDYGCTDLAAEVERRRRLCPQRDRAPPTRASRRWMPAAHPSRPRPVGDRGPLVPLRGVGRRRSQSPGRGVRRCGARGRVARPG